MNQQRNAFLAALAGAMVAVACAPTDAGIGTNVKTNLAADATVKAAPIDVGVEKKTVTLSGTVDTSVIKEQALVVARKTDGVSEVVDQIVVKEQGPVPGFGRKMMGKRMGMEERRESPKNDTLSGPV